VDIRKDILGREPKIGDTIAFNPAGYKGLVNGVVININKSGLPEINPGEKYMGQPNNNGNYAPKTGFVIAKTND